MCAAHKKSRWPPCSSSEQTMFQSSRRWAQALLLAGRLPPITGKCHASRRQLLANALLLLALHRRCRQVLHLEPIRRAAGAIHRVLALRHDAFESHLAGVGEDGRAVALNMLLNRMPGLALATIDASAALRTSSGSRRRSSPFSSIRSKAYRNVLSWRR